MKNNQTKQKVVDAASMLFFQKGFHGTSVRDIASRASVNVSLISYYFNSKQGLLEYAVTNYFEMYLNRLEDVLESNRSLNEIEKLKKIINAVIEYKTDHFQLTSFIHRELSLDSTFVREMTVTYLAKENYIISTLFLTILSEQEKLQQPYLYMQLKGMIMSPFILQHEWKNQLLDTQARKNFIKMHTESINKWLQFVAFYSKSKQLS
ncbi:forespore capture DNA-binding protein RefZ [Pseudogracilibacillus sp. SE30717A]|uniref:forespore capture DNA-binding protein RefZ n=1 Tax=Pseudogracilibacillus sp. SE30717A TaxID=3098293 RepID=UPI00300E4D5E